MLSLSVEINESEWTGKTGIGSGLAMLSLSVVINEREFSSPSSSQVVKSCSQAVLLPDPVARMRPHLRPTKVLPMYFCHTLSVTEAQGQCCDQTCCWVDSPELESHYVSYQKSISSANWSWETTFLATVLRKWSPWMDLNSITTIYMLEYKLDGVILFMADPPTFNWTTLQNHTFCPSLVWA